MNKPMPDQQDISRHSENAAHQAAAKEQPKARRSAVACSALPDASGLWWQWYQGHWRLCKCAYSTIMTRWEFMWIDGQHWFRCHVGSFVRCEPPNCPPNAQTLPTEGAAMRPNEAGKLSTQD